MKIGDLVTVNPARSGMYLIVGEDRERENNWPNPAGVVLGKLYKLYAPEEGRILDMHEKWIVAVDNE